MATTVGLPKFGLTMETGVVSKWLKEEGDWVERGDPLVEISTDKIVNEYESPHSGFLLKKLLPEGQEAEVTAPLCILGEEGEEADAPAAVSPAPAGGDAPAEPPAAARGAPRPGAKMRVSPLARKLAEKHGIDPSVVTGTGPGGRIVRKDVEEFLRTGGQATSAESAPVAAEKTFPLSERRRIIAERLSKSKREIPHFYLKTEVDASRARAIKENLALEKAGPGAKVTLTHLIIKAAAKALAEFPDVNVSFSESGIARHGGVNVGIAVDVADGLMVPVVRDADQRSLGQIAAAVGDLARRARENGLDLSEITGGTFTVTNMGMYGVTEFAAIINPPEAAILAVGTIREAPAVEDGQVVVKPVMTLTLSADHRVIDGGLAARFLGRIRELLEHPELLM